MNLRNSPHTLEPHRFPADDEPGLFHLEHHSITSGEVYYHHHPQFELSLVECERGLRVIGDDHHEFQIRDLVLIGPDTPHRWEMGTTSSGVPMPAEFRVVAFSNRSIGLELLETGDMAVVRRLLSRARHGLSFSVSTIQSATSVMNGLARVEGLDRLLAFFELLRSLCADSEAMPISGHHSRGVTEAEYGVVGRVIEHYQNDVSRRPNLPEAAAMAGMSVPSFTRLFKRIAGHSFVAHMNHLRIVRACTLLEETDMQILDVSLACGFSNLSHFNRLFLRQTGVQPRAYRISAVAAPIRLPVRRAETAPRYQSL